MCVSETGNDRVLSEEECCFNGITAGTRVVDEGIDGCFRLADIFKEMFTKWNYRCYGKFTVCCMKVIAG